MISDCNEILSCLGVRDMLMVRDSRILRDFKARWQDVREDYLERMSNKETLSVIWFL